jgi:hypothetical protein
MLQWHVCAYKYSWSPQRQGLEHVRATADAAVQEYRQTALRFPDDLNSNDTSSQNLRKHGRWK